MEFRLFSKPDYKNGRPGDKDWYATRAVSNHLHEPGHRERLLQALELIVEYRGFQPADATVSDWAAGNGGLLSELKKLNIPCFGYDLSPLAVEWGTKKYGVDLFELDVTKWSEARRAGDIVVMTEFLEHLVDPHDLVAQLRCEHQVGYIVSSVPGFEDPRAPYEYHLWCWHGSSFADMFSRVGWKINRHFFRSDCGTQFVVCSR